MITVRAREILARCEAVVYDRLVSLELIVPLPPSVERHYVGKSARKHTVPQGEINRLLVELARRGLAVARLKGGDPYVFGCGSVEAIYLRKRGVPFEVVPGITAGIAAPAYAGIPVTHRGKAAYAVFLTAHEAAGKTESGLPYELFSRMKDGTLVGYMGVKQLPHVVKKLTEGGMSPDTAVSIIEQGTLGTQRTITGRLEDIEGKAAAANIAPPAVFIIGNVVPLRDSILDQAEKPLSGKIVMVTRPGDQAQDMYRRLRELGAEPLALPSIATESHSDNEGWEWFAGIESGWLIFTSENGVRYFFQGLTDKNYDHRKIAGFKIAAVGAGTEKALARFGFQADFLPGKFTVDTLAAELVDKFDWREVNAVRVRGNLGDDTIERNLAGSGADVLPLTVYRTFTAEWDAGMRAAFEETKVDAVTFTSGSTVRGLLEILGERRFKSFLNRTASISIGPMTSRALREWGIEPSAEAETHTVEGVIDAVQRYFSRKRENTLIL